MEQNAYIVYISKGKPHVKIHKACVASGRIEGCKHLFKFWGNDNPENISDDYYKLFTKEEGALNYAQQVIPNAPEGSYYCAFCCAEKAYPAGEGA